MKENNVETIVAKEDLATVDVPLVTISKSNDV